MLVYSAGIFVTSLTMTPNYSVSNPSSKPVASPSSISIEQQRPDPPTKLPRAHVIYVRGTTDRIFRALEKNP
jgi:hypothetical protein